MIKTIIGITFGFFVGLMLSENVSIVRHNIPSDDKSLRHIYQFIFIFGMGNSSNDYSLHIHDKDQQKSEEND